MTQDNSTPRTNTIGETISAHDGLEDLPRSEQAQAGLGVPGQRVASDEAKHTPGPWMWSKAHNGLTYIYDAKGRVIARVFRPEGMTVEEQQANAQIIARATKEQP